MSRRGGCGAAFTMIELLLVVALMALIAMVTVPSFVQSMRGNRLRAAVRTVISAGRYARSMALLQQRPAELIFNIKESRLEMRLRKRMTEAAVDLGNPAGDGNITEPPLESFSADEFTAEDKTPAAAAFADSLSRNFEGVKIIEVDYGEFGEDSIDEGQVRVITYGSNGRCKRYRVVLEEENGDRAEIKVDALGSATVEWIRR